MSAEKNGKQILNWLVGKFAEHSGRVSNSQTAFCVLSLRKSINILWVVEARCPIIEENSYNMEGEKTISSGILF